MKKKFVWVATVASFIVIGVTLIYYLNKPSTELTRRRAAFTLDDYLQGRTQPKSSNATWLSGNELVYRDSEVNMAKEFGSFVADILIENVFIY